MDLGLEGRVFVLTGATAGLGYAAASALVREGARVVVSSRSPARVEAAVSRLGRQAVGVPAAVEDPATPTLLVRTALRHHGRLDGALLATGPSARGRVCDATDEQWRAHFDHLFLGLLRTATTVAGHLPSGGAIAFVLSTSARRPLPDFGLSDGLRPGLAMAARQMAAELGPDGIRVLSLVPGRFPTPGSPLSPDESCADIPLNRFGTPEEFGKVAAFSLSAAAGYVTGTEIVVDGGKLRC
ncbi:SDR family oxidoreductase [Streptomyces sp. NPDC005012]|uniref:SDR family NAD(P)-dependent oxidoreductase n=1 Tax=unclassified Streptomyces TaxID=2593676 RepID=UPI0033ADC2B9